MFNPVRLLQTWKWPDLFLLHAGRITAIVPPKSVFTEISFCPEQRWRLYCELNVWHCKEQEAASPALKSKHWLQISAGRCSEIAYEQGRKLSSSPCYSVSSDEFRKAVLEPIPLLKTTEIFCTWPQPLLRLFSPYWSILPRCHQSHCENLAASTYCPGSYLPHILLSYTVAKPIPACVSRDKTGVNQHCLEEPGGDYTYWSWGHLFAKGAYRQNMARSWVACYRKC